MAFDVTYKSGAKVFLGNSRKLLILLNLVLVLSITFGAAEAFAEKIKLAVFPINDTMNLDKQKREYLYDVIREAASASAGSYIALIHEQKVKNAAKKKKGVCDEDCAIKSAGPMNARIALVVELTKHDSQVMGVVKLLDVKEEVLLTVKRFFANSVDDVEQELQGAVMFVLSAQFLPISESDRAALQAEQQNIPMTYTRPSQDVQPQQTSPGPPAPPPADEASQPAPQPEYTYSNTDIAQPDEPAGPQAYLVTAIVTGVVGLGLGVGATLTGVQLGREVKKKKNEVNMRNAIEDDYNAVYNGELTEWQFNQFYADKYDGLTITYDDRALVQEVIANHTANIDTINDKITLNGILTGVLGGLSVASIAVSVTFTLKYLDAVKSGGGNARQQGPRFYAAPIIAPKTNGFVFGTTF